MTQPAQTFRIDGIKATVWANFSDSGQKFYTTSLVRSYKDDNDQWKETNTFMADHLPKVELVIREAFKFICIDSRDPSRSGSPLHNGEEADGAGDHSHSVQENASLNPEEESFSSREVKRRSGGRTR